jgi:hypothetical protein
MSIKTQAIDLAKAYDPMWAAVMAETVLTRIPAEDRAAIGEIMYTMRLTEIERALQYAKISGNPRKVNKFLGETRQLAALFCDAIKNNKTVKTTE